MDNTQKQVKRLKKLYNLLYEFSFFRQLVVEERCNLPHKIDPYKIENDEDDQDVLSEYVMPFIKPGDQHLDLIEFLIEKIAKETFDKCRFYEDDPTEFRIKRIRVMASRFGLLAQSKFSKNLNFNKVIEGRSGVEPSVRFIYELAKFVKAYLKTKKPERELTHRQIFLDCTYTMSNLINIDVNPFSVDFPLENELLQHDDLQFHIGNIEEEVNKDNEYLADIAEGDQKQKDTGNDIDIQLENEMIELERDAIESFDLCKEDLSSYKNQLDYLKEQITTIFDLGRKETAKLQKKIQQQDFDKQDEKIINIDSKFQKIYRHLQSIQEQVVSCNKKHNITERLEDLVERISLLEQNVEISQQNQSQQQN